MAFIQYITQIHLDFGVISKLREECERTGMRKPLIVTDAGVRAAGVLDRALAALGDLTALTGAAASMDVGGRMLWASSAAAASVEGPCEAAQLAI